MSGHRRPNPRLVKIHRSYTVEEVARTLRTHKNTVRAWIRQGLQTIDSERPALVHGLELRRFLESRRKKAKRPCPPGYIYCVKCRAPKAPAGSMADYLAITATSGNLRGICPDCETLIHRRVSLARINTIQAGLEVTFQQAGARIGERACPSVSCDSRADGETHDNA
jgi:hypothetical protein